MAIKKAPLAYIPVANSNIPIAVAVKDTTSHYYAEKLNQYAEN